MPLPEGFEFEAAGWADLALARLEEELAANDLKEEALLEGLVVAARLVELAAAEPEPGALVSMCCLKVGFKVEPDLGTSGGSTSQIARNCSPRL